MSLKILLADDSMTAQNMGKKILTDAGYEVVAVSNGAAAMKKIKADKFDLLILDVFMPGYTGLEVCEKLRAMPDRVGSLVLLTVGKMEPFNADEGNKVKADGVIVKPFEASDLVATVQKIAAKASAAPKADLDRTVRLAAPIVAESDESYQEWSVTSTPPAEEETRPVQHVEMTAEVAGTAALDHIFDEPAATESAPTQEFSAGSAKLSPWTSEPAAEAPAAAAAAPAGSAWSSGSDWEHPGAAVEPPTAAAPAILEAPAAIEAHDPLDFGVPQAPAEVPLEAVEPAPSAHLELESLLEHTGPAPAEHEFHAAPGIDPNLVTDRAQLVSEFATKFTAPEEADPKMGILPAVTEEPAAVAAEAPAAEVVEEAAPEPVPEPAAGASPGLAHEMEQAFASIPAEAPEPPPAPAAPATLEQSLEQSIVAAESSAPEAAVEPQKTGDLEFAAALAQAISNAPVATAEPIQPVAPAATPAAMLTRFDQDAVTRAVHRVMDRMKAEIIEEILRESNK